MTKRFHRCARCASVEENYEERPEWAWLTED